MSSHAQDQKTQTTASTGATQQDQQLAANAAKNQAFSDQTRTSLFGTYNPSTNSYTGGTESNFLNPANLSRTSLYGSYLNQYNNASNQLAQNTQNAVGTTMQNMNSRGMGATPNGFAADQERQAYQTQAGQQGSLYSGAFSGQHAEDLNNFTNATNLLNSNATGAANLSLSGNTAAAGNYSGLYGTASQQVASPWSTVLGAAGTLAGAGATAYAGR